MMFGDKVQSEILTNQMQQCFNIIPKSHQLDQTIGVKLHRGDGPQPPGHGPGGLGQVRVYTNLIPMLAYENIV